ncbi:pyridoxamine 5'-phosphate oxidase domain-containing protein [Sarocladium implicatum]|nr:pyridoxamine 5'-phosphate oxidase domain-containing protein [Sarocladium implicatum]
MGRHELQYPKDAKNTVKRHNERGIYALTTIHNLINASPILHLSFNTPDSPFPSTLPMIGQMASFDRPSSSTSDPLDLYLHGYVSSRVMNLARSGQGLPVCIAASHVDGYVLALSAFNHSYNYRSAILFGYATLVESEEEKVFALEKITDGVVPGRWSDTRLPLLGSELQSTSVLKVKIESGSAKVRAAQASDDKHDLENEEALNKIWTGVVPVYQTFGEPVPGPYNRAEFPSYAAEYIADSNKDSKEYSVAAATTKDK